MENQPIVVRGAREHNLRGVSVELPRNSLIVFTGVSGSGKSSLAFDTIFAEGQRRYIESLSSYARQFLGQLPKPDVDYIGGLAPAIAIQQKTASRNPRSTVGTVTEISDFLRVLFARVGQGYCSNCKKPITAQTREQILDRIFALPPDTRLMIMAPVVRGQKGEFKDFFADMLRKGFVRARVDGRLVKMGDNQQLDRKIKHNIEIVVDRLKNDPRTRSRMAEAVEQALTLAEGALILGVEVPDEANDPNRPATEDILLSSHYACTKCGISYESPTPQLFSFNSPQGMCPDCDGIGTRYTFDPALLIPDPKLSFYDGAIPLVGKLKGMGKWRKHIYEGIAAAFAIDLKTPWKDLPEEHQQVLLMGGGDTHVTYEWKQRGGGSWKHGGKWEGVVPQLYASFKKAAPGPRRMQLEKYMRVVKCGTCFGERLNAQARAVRVADKTLIQLGSMPIGELVPWFESMEPRLSPTHRIIATELLKEIRARLSFLLNVGLDYLSLDRSAPTLSGGEAQRIRLAGQIGSGLVGVLYVLDEPSIGLHSRDNERLIRSLEKLRDMGNTVLVVEHDEDTMCVADYLVDFGPGPGVRGGEIVAAGTPKEVLANPASLTAKYLTGELKIPIPEKRRAIVAKNSIQILKARHNNLLGITVSLPLGVFVGFTGVSGSGKSSLVNDILLDGLKEIMGAPRATDKDEEEEEDAAGERVVGVRCEAIKGAEKIDKIIAIDQSPIGRTPRSNPATYIKVWDEIRILYSEMSEAKTRGYLPGRFSFNRPGGRCEACEGNGATKLEMDFLADVWVTCPVCEGHRFNRETLQVLYRGKSIQDVLQLDVQDALVHFEHHPKIRPMLQTLHDVGLDYIKLGQPSPTLSGGESQRIKLAKELCRRATGKTLYILDEPTTGLHFEDIRKLLDVLHGFVAAGNTVVVIEHNLDVIKTCDWLIDLGPEGGSRGGRILCEGTPEAVAACTTSYTGQALIPVLKGIPGGNLKPIRAIDKKSLQKERITHLNVEGATQHNLKNISVSMPREKMTVFCGPSGSGKSSLAIDTIYAEGQRRYVESLSSYARQFLGQVQKPKVEHVTGLSPAISIEQKAASRSPRSTVGTITEVYDYLRVLYARLGQYYCPKCHIPIGTQSADEIIDRVMALPEGTKLYLMAPMERRGNEDYTSIFDDIRRAGFIRVRIDGKSHTLDNPPEIDHKRKHSVEVVVDRNLVKPGNRTRIADSVEACLTLGRGVMHIGYVDPDRDETQWKVDRFSQHLACNSCGKSYERLNPHNFSFNSPLGWCNTCEGLGIQKGAQLALLVRDGNLTLRQGALTVWPLCDKMPTFVPFAEAIAKQGNLSLDTPWDQLEPGAKRTILYGTGEVWMPLPTGQKVQYKGIYPAIDEASRVSYAARARLDSMVDEVPCSTCAGSRLRVDAANVRYMGLTIGDLCGLPMGDTLKRFEALKLPEREQKVAGELLREIVNRVRFLVDVGLEYLALSRPGPTLSGGETQRIRLASQIGSGLTGVLYVLDEPTIGLHPRDNARLLKALHNLRDLGNTLLLVEHDREVIKSADYLIDFGPGAGDFGGEVIAEGSPKQILRSAKSLTGQYLSGKKNIPIPSNRRITAKEVPNVPCLKVIGARQHNLRNLTVVFPLGCMIAVTGVSGSGKSSLVSDILYNTLARRLNRARTVAAVHDDILGIDYVDKIIAVDQDPLGNSPSSNPATYTGVFDLIRQLYAQLPDSRIRGYQPRRFSFNQQGGRCDACDGNGQKLIEMHFLPDIWVECDTCHGHRYNPETLAVRYHNKSIADVLNMRISEALELFHNIPKIRAILKTLDDVGLGYLTLGQSAPTMSGGEAQRVKLAAELSRPSTGKTLYLLDEPTTGLHFDDIRKLLDVLHRLVDLGNTVIVVEHNLDVIKTSDWIIDIGPDAGTGGGQLVACGTPEDVVAAAKAGVLTYTGQILEGVLKDGPYVVRKIFRAQDAIIVRDGDLDLDQIGKDTLVPWQVDGKKWHTSERVTTQGKTARWEGKILTVVEDLIRAQGEFSETDWSDRTTVEICAPVKSKGWFFHAHTGMEWLVRLVFRMGRNTFRQETLNRMLAIKPLNEMKGLEVYSNEDRVKVANRQGPWQEVWMLVHKVEEIDTDAFRAFVKTAAESFSTCVGRMASDTDKVTPWKTDGEAWHQSVKGFPPGKKRKWDTAILPPFLKMLQELDENLVARWDARDAVSFKYKGISVAWVRVRTKSHECVEARFAGKAGILNLDQLAGMGRDPELSATKADGSQVMILRFKATSDMPMAKLKLVLKRHLDGFREIASEGE